MRVCNNTGACFPIVNNTINIENSLNEDSVMRDARLDPHFIYNEHNRRLLIESGIMTANETWEEYRRMIFRTLLRPSKVCETPSERGTASSTNASSPSAFTFGQEDCWRMTASPSP